MNKQQTTESVFNIERIYLKDLSLEQPNSPAIFTTNEQPTLDINFTVGHNALDDGEGFYEVYVQATVQTKITEKTVFLIQAKQAGIFLFKNIPNEHIEQLLSVRCPQILYPYLRANVANTINVAGFPPVHLPEISFEQLYQQRLEKEQKKAENKNQQ